MARRRGGPRRSEVVDDYLNWRRAEEEAARIAEPWGGRVDDVAAAMPADPVTVKRWRRTLPSVEAFRAWLHEKYDSFDGMTEAIDRGDLDGIAGTPPPLRTQRDYLAEVIPMLAEAHTWATGERATTAELARQLGVSRRTVGRHRTD